MNYKNQHVQKSGSFLVFLLLTFTAILSSCSKSNTSTPAAGNEGRPMLVLWNDAGHEAWVRFSSTTGPSPMQESRFYAIVDIAMYDVLNGIRPKYKMYALTTTQPGDASIDAAIATAAHDAMVAALPPQAAYADSLLKVSLAGISDGTAKQKGIDAGKAAATAIIAMRNNDGSATSQATAFVQGTLPGEYRTTAPFDAPPFNNFVSEAGWGMVKPFGLTSSSQFRVVPPYAVTSAEYATDFNEIKSIGGMASTTRTAEQTEIAEFWVENPPATFNRIAKNLIISKDIDTWQAARLFALLEIAEADANIGSFDSKFFYHFWRPVTAIHLGDADNNPNTTGDPTWSPLVLPTPPIPDYPSNHAVNGGAGAEVLKGFFGTDDMSFDATSLSLPGVTRHYNSFSQAATDNAMSRIYVGYHFRNSSVKGLDEGQKIGKYIFDNYLK